MTSLLSQRQAFLHPHVTNITKILLVTQRYLPFFGTGYGSFCVEREYMFYDYFCNIWKSFRGFITKSVFNVKKKIIIPTSKKKTLRGSDFFTIGYMYIGFEKKARLRSIAESSGFVFAGLNSAVPH